MQWDEQYGHAQLSGAKPTLELMDAGSAPYDRLQILHGLRMKHRIEDCGAFSKPDSNKRTAKCFNTAQADSKTGSVQNPLQGHEQPHGSFVSNSFARGLVPPGTYV